MFSLNEEGKFVEKLSILMNKWKEQFVFIWSGKFDFYQGKVREL